MVHGLFLNKSLKIALSIVGVASMISCGSSSSNNDQGTSFLAVGFSRDGNGENGASGAILPLFTDDTNFGVANTSPNGGARPVDGQFATVFMGFQNRLSKQFIRVVRIDCDYEVEGSFINIPSDSFPVGGVLGRAESDDKSTPNVLYTEFLVVSPDLYSFLNNNQNLLPQMPFRMTATCSATGVTQGGDTLTTNSLNYFMQFVEESECCTGENGLGFQGGVGNGGNLITSPEDDPTVGDGPSIIGVTGEVGAADGATETVTDSGSLNVINIS